MIAIHHYTRDLIQFPYTPHLQGELLTHVHGDQRLGDYVDEEEKPRGRGDGNHDAHVQIGPTLEPADGGFPRWLS
jgi:hypothetical protein